jgi:hypothetical protein
MATKKNCCDLVFVCNVEHEDADCRFRKSGVDARLCIHERCGLCQRKEAKEFTVKEYYEKQTERKGVGK